MPFAKFIALNKNNITFPFKRYEIAKVFRDGPIKAGRDREFSQCDADVVGIKGQLIEAELLSLFVKVFKNLKIDIYIKYNSRNLMNGLIKEAGIREELVASVTTIIDKKDKITNEEFEMMLENLGVSKKEVKMLENYFTMNLDDLKNEFLSTSNEDIKEGLAEVEKLTE